MRAVIEKNWRMKSLRVPCTSVCSECRWFERQAAACEICWWSFIALP